MGTASSSDRVIYDTSEEDETCLRKERFRDSPIAARVTPTKHTAVLSGGSFSGYGSDNSRPSTLNVIEMRYSGGTSPTHTSLQKYGSNLSFVAHYFIEHIVNAHIDTVSSLCLKYGLLNKDALFEVNDSITTDDESLFHIHTVYIPVDQNNCTNVKAAHTIFAEQFRNIDISNWEMRKKLSRKEESVPQNHSLLGDSDNNLPTYADDLVICREEGLVIRQYYWPNGTDKIIPYDCMMNVEDVKIDSLRGPVSIPGTVFVERFCYPYPQFDTGFIISDKGSKFTLFFIARDQNLFKKALFRKMRHT